jgi:acetylornithine deacetylase/succinyl-diaminopimelate desuccinylase-like protein
MKPAPATPAGFKLPAKVHDEALALFRDLLRVDTTNPPGKEEAAAKVLGAWLKKRGLKPTLLKSAPGRANLVCRIGPEAGGALLLNGHLDVVPADPQRWTHPPFEATIADGFVWGRGAVDMKHMVAMSAALMAHMHAVGVADKLLRPVILAAVADEEAGCEFGSAWLVDNHPDHVQAEYALGELGGFPLWIGGDTPVIPVQVAEKGIAWLRMHAHGHPGHGSVPRPDTAVIRLAQAIARIGKSRLPQHVTPPVDRFVRALAGAQPPVRRLALLALLNPRASGVILDKIMPDKDLANVFAATLSNTASPTVLAGGSKTNVIPGTASVELDGRTLPGQTTDDLIRELRAIVGPDLAVEFEIIQSQSPTVFPSETPLMKTIQAVLGEAVPGAAVIPNLIPGFTDAKHWSRLGTVAYGFSPVWFSQDAGTTFGKLYHGDDERIPVDGFHWGLEILHETVRRFCAP